MLKFIFYQSKFIFGWTVGCTVTEKRQRKLDGMVTEPGRDGHGKWTVSGQKRKIYCIRYLLFLTLIGHKFEEKIQKTWKTK
jgi:hypothetical protein